MICAKSNKRFNCPGSWVVFILLCVQIAPGLHGQGCLRADGAAIINESHDTILLRGMGLGGWMLQEGYMLQTSEFANAQREIRSHIEELVGVARTDTFYNAWLTNHVTRKDIDSLSAWGFNLVRLPMHYNLYTLPVEEEPVPGTHTWLEKGFALTDSLLEWCKSNEIYLLLDLHAAPGGQGMDEGISDYDPSKPSLWESRANRDKTVALWKRLAERYSDERWMAGYDLLNEPNWPMNGNVPLRDLYLEITDSIRTVDTTHLIFIEGNWFANDFTGLTPPWDDKLVYSPHKYWSLNDKASIQWALDLRDIYNVPVFFGECGENSNVWFRDAIRLFEDEGLGWAWWPMKKIESISGPLSVIKTEGYNELLEYWKGNAPRPGADEAFMILMDLAEKLKIGNCIFQKDVIDAMFRQVNSAETLPYIIHTIPGTVFATDFSMGRIGEAYFDVESANYSVSTGNYTSWNNGWAYRNDGVDIEHCDDPHRSNGFNIGWTEKGEWMRYDVKIIEAGVYDVNFRLASESGEGKFHFRAGQADITGVFEAPSTGSWNQWVDYTVPGILLDTSDTTISLFIDQGGVNISSMTFNKTGSLQSVPTRLVGAKTRDIRTIQLDINKALVQPIPGNAQFELYVDGTAFPVDSWSWDTENSRILYLHLDRTIRWDNSLRVSMNAGDIKAVDGTNLQLFDREPVINTLDEIFPIPGRIEAEAFIKMEGIQLESTTDTGGGDNIAYLDRGDYALYNVEVLKSGSYSLRYRVASQQNTGSLKIEMVNSDGDVREIDRINVHLTGGWQQWSSIESGVSLDKGIYTMRLEILNGPFNLNWMEFINLEEPEEILPLGVAIMPNPVIDQLTVRASFSVPHNIGWELYDASGARVLAESPRGYSKSSEFHISTSDLSPGFYIFCLYLEDNTTYKFRVIKV